MNSASAGPSRRVFLLSGGAALLLGAGAGVGAGLTGSSHPRRPPPTPPPPAELTRALAAELALIADLDATIAGGPAGSAGPAGPAGSAGSRAAAGPGGYLAVVRADHRAHADAIRGALRHMGGADPTPSGSASRTAAPPAPAGRERSQDELRAAEQAAAVAGAARAAALSGAPAALLASIAACETAHADLLAPAR